MEVKADGSEVADREYAAADEVAKWANTISVANYVKVKAEPTYNWGGHYIISWSDNKPRGVVDSKDLKVISEDETFVDGDEISAISGLAVEVVLNDGAYSIKLPNGKYLELASKETKQSDDKIKLYLKYNASKSGVQIASGDNDETAFILYQQSSYYRAYAGKLADANYKLPTLYRLKDEAAYCADGPYGLNVNGVADTLKYIYDKDVEDAGGKQYGINGKALAKDDIILLENLSCGGTWLPTIEDGGASANFEVVTVGSDKHLKVKTAGTYNFYFKNIYGADKLYIAFTPVEKWYIVGDFTGWFENKAELEATAQADSLAKVIEVESDTLAHFLLVRITETGPAKDTAYYGTHIFEGNLEVMQYGKSSGFWFYADAEKNDVPFQPTNAGDDYTFCVNLKHQDGDKHAPLVSIIIPEETPIEKTFKVKVPAGTEEVYMAGDWDPAVTGWEFVKMTADGENQFKHTATVLKSFEYKYCSAEDFEHVEVAANRSDIANRTYGDTTDVVALFKNPKWTNIYLWRKSNDWKAEEFEATDNADSIVVKVNYAAALPLDSFLIKDGDTYYKIALDAIDMTRSNSTDWGLSDALDTKNVTIVIDQAGEYTFVWNSAQSKVSVIYPAEAKQDITFKVKTPGAVECYIAGDWDLDGTWTFKKMNAVNAIDHQFELKVENIVASVPYKYSSAADWDHVDKAFQTLVCRYAFSVCLFLPFFTSLQ